MKPKIPHGGWMATLLVAVLAGATPAGATGLAITGARAIPAPDAEAIEDVVILIDGGRIEAIGTADGITVAPDVPVLDLQGATVVAGFWNSHVHLVGPGYQDAASRPAAGLAERLREQYLRWGFTTVYDLGSFPGDALAIGRRIEAGEIEGPRVLSVGMPFYPEGGTPIYVRELFAAAPQLKPEVGDVDEARARVDAQLGEGHHGVKLFAGSIVGGDDGVRLMDPRIAASIAQAARARGGVVFAHPTTMAGIGIAIEAGVQALAHSAPAAGPWDADTVSRLVDAGVALVPTLALFELELRREQVPQAVFDRFMDAARQQVGALSAAGGTVLFGTDAGFIEHFDTRRELELMAEAGLDWRRILESLTTAPARKYRDAGRGRIAAGAIADLVVLGSAPERDPAAFADVHYVLRDGRVVYRREGGAPGPALATAVGN